MKVFGIGLSKTGTSSLASALELLGYNVKDCLGVTNYSRGDIASINKEALVKHSALTDTPIPSFYRELDIEYPSSKFILTVRDMDGWLKSCKKQFNQKSADKQSVAHNELFFDLYGTTVFDEDKFTKGYIDFVDDVMTYFKNRPNDLLVLNVTSGEGWEKLCPFLDKPIPEIPFPKSNVTQIRWLNIHELAQSTRNTSLQLHKLSENLTTHQSTGSNKIKSFLASFVHLDIDTRINNCANNIQKKITKELLALNPHIPIISNKNHDIPLESRSSWNHFWLVSCSEGVSQLKNGCVGYTVNVALIEDGRPYLGIVFVPALDLLYYAAIGKGAYKAQGNSDSLKIEPLSIVNKHSPTKPKPADNITNTVINSSHAIGHLICQNIENNDYSRLSIEDSLEWQTAAGHAILKTLGITLVDKTSSTELKYNKNDWTNTSIAIDIA